MIKKILVSLIVFMCIFLSNFNPVQALGKKSSVVYFCTNWNVNCSKTSAIVKKVINDGYRDKTDFLDLDVDSPTTPDKAMELNISVPYKVPYIYILDSKNKVLYKKQLANESYDSIKSILDSNLPH